MVEVAVVVAVRSEKNRCSSRTEKFSFVARPIPNSGKIAEFEGVRGGTDGCAETRDRKVAVRRWMRVYRAVCKVYRPLCSVNGPLGAPFKSVKEVRERLLTESTALGQIKAMETAEKESVDDALVFKLLRLSGLNPRQVDLDEIKSCLERQMQLVNVLHSVPLPEGATFDLQRARLLPRDTKPIKYKELLQLIKDQEPKDDEIEGFWDATSLTDSVQNGYFVVNKKTKS